MNEHLAAYEISVAANLTTEVIKANISPFLKSFISGQPSAHDEWMQSRGNQRLEKLIQEIQELEKDNQNLKQSISNLEKQSPGSGYTKTLFKFITTPLDEKVELLQNALLNGLYSSDYTIEIREQFYMIVQAIQPFDVELLQYLIKECPNIQTYMQTYQEKGDGTNIELPLSLNLKNVMKDGSSDPKSIQSYFRDKQEMVLVTSLERLKQQSLITHPTVGIFGIWSPYQQCVPTDIAKSFLDFLSDRRNSLKRKEDGDDHR